MIILSLTETCNPFPNGRRQFLFGVTNDMKLLEQKKLLIGA